VIPRKHISIFPLLAFVVFMAGVLPAAGQDKKDLYNLATAAARAGKVEESVEFYCQAAHIDPAYKNAKLMCTVMTLEKQKEEKKNEERFTVGVQDFNAAKYDEAQQKFRNIRFGPRYEEAQLYLTVKIPQSRQAAANKAKEAEKKPQ
jgi:hypothetical protein